MATGSKGFQIWEAYWVRVVPSNCELLRISLGFIKQGVSLQKSIEILSGTDINKIEKQLGPLEDSASNLCSKYSGLMQHDAAEAVYWDLRA